MAKPKKTEADHGADDQQPEDGKQVTIPVTEEPAPEVTKIVTPPLAEDAGAVMGGGASMPEVQDHALQAAREDQTAQTAPPAPVPSGAAPIKGKTDQDGRPYDPAIHESPMRINRDGWIAKRRGTGAKGAAGPGKAPLRSRVAPASATAPQGVPPAPPPDPEIAIRAAAEQSAGLFFGAAMLVGGEDFKPEDRGEQDMVVATFGNYFRAKGVPDIPPGVALAMGLGMYVAKRWNKPQFKERRLGWWTNVKRWWHDWKYRRSLRASAPPAERVPFERAVDFSPAG